LALFVLVDTTMHDQAVAHCPGSSELVPAGQV